MIRYSLTERQLGDRRILKGVFEFTTAEEAADFFSRRPELVAREREIDLPGDGDRRDGDREAEAGP